MKRIALIGGGASNLLLAALLSNQNNIEVDIIEIRDRVGKKIGLILSISKTAKLKSEEWILALSKTKSIGISKDNKSRIIGLSKLDNNLGAVKNLTGFP